MAFKRSGVRSPSPPLDTRGGQRRELRPAPWRLLSGRYRPPPRAGPAGTVLDLVTLYTEWVRANRTKVYEAGAAPEPTSEYHCVRAALQRVVRLHAHVHPAAYGPAHLEAVRALLIGGAPEAPGGGLR